MADTSRHDAWQAGGNYDRYMGRWSRRIAPRFLAWLDLPPGLDWLEVGCGTGALSGAITERCAPRSLVSIDPSEGFVRTARAAVPDQRTTFQVGDAQALPVESASRDVVASGLVLNFVPDKPKALTEMQRAARKDATIAFYVWDYPGGGVEFMRAFWTAAKALNPAAGDLTEDKRFPFCSPDGLTDLASQAGLTKLQVSAIEIPTTFRDFEDYWQPFTLGAGPAPGYCASLAPQARQELRDMLEQSLPRQADGSIHLRARAWAVRATMQR